MSFKSGVSLLTAGIAIAASTFGACAICPAIAQTPAYRPWTGFYIGVSGGYGWGADRDSDVKLNPIGTPDPGNGLPSTFLDVGVNKIPTSLNSRADGLIGGGHVGYNLQSGVLVMGIVADLSKTDISGSVGQTAMGFSAGNPAPFSLDVTTKKGIDFLGTLRGRIGFTPTPWFLMYASGGLAYARVSSSTTLSDIPSGFQITPSSGSASQGLTGWTVGGGFETYLGARWSLNIEYLYYDLGHVRYAMTPSMASDGFNRFGIIDTTVNAEFRGDLMRIGLDYKLN